MDVSFSCPTRSDSVVAAVVERAIALQKDPSNDAKLIVVTILALGHEALLGEHDLAQAFSDDGTSAAMLSRMRPYCKVIRRIERIPALSHWLDSGHVCF